MNTPPDDERPTAAEPSVPAEDGSPWVWRTREAALAHADSRYPWLAKMVGRDALYRLAFDLLLEKRK